MKLFPLGNRKARTNLTTFATMHVLLLKPLRLKKVPPAKTLCNKRVFKLKFLMAAGDLL
jgi:hypothetical protein